MPKCPTTVFWHLHDGTPIEVVSSLGRCVVVSRLPPPLRRSRRPPVGPIHPSPVGVGASPATACGCHRHGVRRRGGHEEQASMSWPRRTAPAVGSGREGSAPTPQPARRRVACALARVVRLVWCRRRPTRRRPRATAPFTRLPPDPTPPPARLPTPPTRLALPAARPASAPTAPAGCAGPPIDPPRTAGRVRTSPTPAAHARARWTLVQRRRCEHCQADRQARRGGFPCRRSSTGETPVADNVRHGLEVSCLHNCERGLCWLIVQEIVVL